MENPIVEELLHKIQELESAHACFRDEISELLLSETLASDAAAVETALPVQIGAAGGLGYSDSTKRLLPFQVDHRDGGWGDSSRSSLQGVKPRGSMYLNILQSMGQAIHILDIDDCFIYW